MPSPHPVAVCIARARHERRLGLAALGHEASSSNRSSADNKKKSKRWDEDKEKNKKDKEKSPAASEELLFILGLSWRLRDSNSDVDVVGGLDLGWLSALLRPADDLLSGLRLPLRFLGRGEASRDSRGGTFQGVEGLGNGPEARELQRCRALPSLREALLHALPAHSDIPPRLPLSDPSDPYIPALPQQSYSHAWSREHARKQEDFAALLSQVDRDSVAALCTQVLKDIRASGTQRCVDRRRTTRGGGDDSDLPPLQTQSYVPPPVIGDPILGSTHALWPVWFPGTGEDNDGEDGDTRWMVKVPLCGTPDTWDAVGAKALRDEAGVLRLLGTMGKRRAGGEPKGEREAGERGPESGEDRPFPAPRPVQAHTGVHNALHAPYLIMEYIDGVRLDEYWFEGVGGGDDGLAYSAEQIHFRRRAVLRSLASHLLRLSRFETRRSGAVVVGRVPHVAGPDGRRAGALGVRPRKAAPVRALDVQAMLDRWFDSGDDGADPETRWEVERTTERTLIYTVIQPQTKPRNAYLALLDQYSPQTVAARGVHELLRLLVGMLEETPRPGARGNHQQDEVDTDYDELDYDDDIYNYRKSKPRPRPRPFVLAHTNLQLHHVIVSEDNGEVRGIVGWDGVCAAPKSIGNEALPRWLVRDLNPFTYRWTPEVEVSADVGGARVVRTACQPLNGESVDTDVDGEVSQMGIEDPPWVLAELRRLYVDTVAELKGEIIQGYAGSVAGGTGGDAGQDYMKACEERKDFAAFFTKQSLLALVLDEAVRDPRSRSAILRQVLARCSRRFETLDYESIVEALGTCREPDAYMMQCLRRNIRELFDKGFVKGAAVW